MTSATITPDLPAGTSQPTLNESFDAVFIFGRFVQVNAEMGFF